MNWYHYSGLLLGNMIIVILILAHFSKKVEYPYVADLSDQELRNYILYYRCAPGSANEKFEEQILQREAQCWYYLGFEQTALRKLLQTNIMIEDPQNLMEGPGP